jgi:hypothetical protein
MNRNISITIPFGIFCRGSSKKVPPLRKRELMKKNGKSKCDTGSCKERGSPVNQLLA